MQHHFSYKSVHGCRACSRYTERGQLNTGSADPKTVGSRWKGTTYRQRDDKTNLPKRSHLIVDSGASADAHQQEAGLQREKSPTIKILQL
eukprot:4150713-Amphidinium_carterae.1